MASSTATVNNFNLVSMFNIMPIEILMYILKECRPEDLYKLISISTRFYNLVMHNISHFTNYYAKNLLLDTEKFMWNLFDDEIFNDKNKEELFVKMLQVHVFANSNYLEFVWQQTNMEDNEDFGHLPTNPTELYIKKIQTGMIKMFSEFDLLQSSKFSYEINNDVFELLFKIIKKYPIASYQNSDNLVSHIEDFFEQNMNFEWISEYIQEALSYNAEEEDIFDVLTDETYIDEYINLLHYGVEPEEAKFDIHGYIYMEEQLNTYNTIRYVIGNKLAHYYILDNELNIDSIPNFLINVNLLYSIGIDNIEIINKFLENPTDALFDNIKLQYETSGSVDMA
jgi:hypothetical protein